MSSILQRQSTFYNCDLTVSSYYLAKNGFVYDIDTQSIKCCECFSLALIVNQNVTVKHLVNCSFNIFESNSANNHIPNISQTTRGANVCELTKKEIARRPPIDWDYYKSYNNRLESFFDWPRNSIFDPKEFARCGLFFSGIRDKVICFSCKKSLSKWELSDVIFDEHLRHYPECFFIQSLLAERNSEKQAKINKEFEKVLEPTAPPLPSATSAEKEIDYKQLYEDLKDKSACVICMITERTHALLPCGHMISCKSCTNILEYCPICRLKIRGSVAIFLS